MQIWNPVTLKAHAKEIARVAARTTLDMDAAGKVSVVTSPIAIRVLERAYTQMLRHGGRPIALQITEKEARSFPCQKDEPSGCQFFIAVGLDIDGKACMSIQGAAPTWNGPGEMPEEVRSQALAAAADYSRSSALAQLEKLAAMRGFG